MNLRLINFEYMTTDEAKKLLVSMSAYRFLNLFYNEITRQINMYLFKTSDGWAYIESICDNKIQWIEIHEPQNKWVILVMHAHTNKDSAPFQQLVHFNRGELKFYFYIVGSLSVGFRYYNDCGKIKIRATKFESREALKETYKKMEDN